jgi:hypothetical protein
MHTRNNAPTSLAIVLAATLAPAACMDPCEAIITAETLVVTATDCIPETSLGGDTGDTSTGPEPDPVTPLDMGPAPIPVCIAIPAPGEQWGPCDANDACAPGLDCKTTPMGSVCLGACDPNTVTVCDADKCLGGTCEAGIDACVAPCHAVGDPCPLPGMQCDYNSGAPLCVHPN